MFPAKALETIAARIEGLPEWLRPAAYGAGLVVVLTLSRAGLIVGPVLVAYLLLKSRSPWADLRVGATVLFLAIAGGALGGLAYGAVGRRVRNAFPGGRYLAGIVSVWPYTLVLSYLRGIVDDVPKPLWRWLTVEEFAISTFVGVLFGLVVGHSWFAPDIADESGSSADETTAA